MPEIRFCVLGDPVPQPRARHAARNGFVRTYTPDNGIEAYKSAIGIAAQAAGISRLASPLVVEVEAVFGRPPSHLLKSGALRKGAPGWPRPDWDNIAKGVCDALLAQDSVITKGSCEKRYALPGEIAHTVVVVMER